MTDTKGVVGGSVKVLDKEIVKDRTWLGVLWCMYNSIHIRRRKSIRKLNRCEDSLGGDGRAGGGTDVLQRASDRESSTPSNGRRKSSYLGAGCGRVRSGVAP